jgi:tetratricopeptide (TPR) repeat protein
VSSVLTELDGLGDNHVFIPKLVEQMRSTRTVVPFVGAGLSVPYHLPQWGELLLSLSGSPKTTREIEHRLGRNDYEGAAEHLLRVRGADSFHELLKRTLQIPVKLGADTPVTALARFPTGPIITTNFDCVLETVFRAAGIEMQVIVGNQRRQIGDAFQFNRNALLKIHGDAATSDAIVLAATQYSKAYDEWLSRILGNLATNPILFVGCSLRTDRTAKVLQRLVRRGQVDTRHYAILAMPASDDEIIRRTRDLSEDLHVDVIWYPPGAHEYLERILAYLADEVPPERRRTWTLRIAPLHRGIPAAPKVFYARQSESDEVRDAVNDHSIVTIEGPRGAGKTALALHVLGRLLHEDTFGALVWVTAAAQKEHLKLENVLEEISLTIDFPFRTVSPAEREAKLAQELERKRIRCLLLLDNYETVSDEDIHRYLERLPEYLHVLITSTGRLVEHPDKRIPLDELKEADALRLVRRLLHDDGLAAESDSDLERLYEVVGGNPLALHWIVGQLPEGRRLPRLLDSLARGNEDVLERVFGQSWLGLTRDAQTLLEAMAVFVKPALEEAMIATSGLADDAFDRALGLLSRMYLVRRLQLQDGGIDGGVNPRKHFIHPFTRDYLEAHRQRRTALVMYDRAAQFYLRYVDDRGGGAAEMEGTQGQAELNDQRENIFGVLNSCLAYGHERAIVDLTQAMARWLFIGTHWADLKRWGDKASRLAVQMGDQHAAARILTEVGRVYSHQSNYAKADEIFDTALGLADVDPPDSWALAYLGHHRGEERVRQRRFEEAHALLADSLARFDGMGSTRDTMGVRYRLAMLYFETGRTDLAMELGQQGVRDAEHEGWDRLVGLNHRLLGDVAVREKRHDDARFHYVSALDLIPTSDMRGQAFIELSLARLESEMGTSEPAEAYATSAQTHFDKIGMRSEADEAAKLLIAVRGDK